MMFQAIQQSQDIHADTILFWITETVIVGLVASHASLWMSHMKHKQHVAEHYVSNPDIDKLDKRMDEMQKTLMNILSITSRLEGRSEGIKHE